MQLEHKAEVASTDEVAHEYAEAAIKRMIRALAIRQAKVDLNARVAANDNETDYLNNTLGI